VPTSNNLIGTDIFPENNIWLFMLEALLSLVVIGIVYMRQRVNPVPWLASISIALTLSAYHLIQEKGNLIHQSSLFQNISGSAPITMISGNSRIATYAQLYWLKLDKQVTHRLVYDYPLFTNILNYPKMQYAFCSEQGWLSLPQETSRNWEIIETIYDVKKELFHEPAGFSDSKDVEVAHQRFIKYFETVAKSCCFWDQLLIVKIFEVFR